MTAPAFSTSLTDATPAKRQNIWPRGQQAVAEYDRSPSAWAASGGYVRPGECRKAALILYVRCRARSVRPSAAGMRRASGHIDANPRRQGGTATNAAVGGDARPARPFFDLPAPPPNHPEVQLWVVGSRSGLERFTIWETRSYGRSAGATAAAWAERRQRMSAGQRARMGAPARLLLAWQITPQWTFDPALVTEVGIFCIPDSKAR
jgi:hypothetical protein